MRIRPVSRDALLRQVAHAVLDRAGGRRVRVAIDGAVPLRPDLWAANLVTVLRDAGRYALHVSIRDFLQPASLRFEFGRTSPDAFYEGWRDEGALRREVLDPAAASDGSVRVLPVWWRTDIDRSARAEYVPVPVDGVVIVSGEFLLGSGLPFDYTVHLTASGAALARLTDDDQAWTLPAYERYDGEVAPATLADVVIRLEDPRRPALVEAAADP